MWSFSLINPQTRKIFISKKGTDGLNGVAQKEQNHPHCWGCECNPRRHAAHANMQRSSNIKHATRSQEIGRTSSKFMNLNLGHHQMQTEALGKVEAGNGDVEWRGNQVKIKLKPEQASTKFLRKFHPVCGMQQDVFFSVSLVFFSCRCLIFWFLRCAWWMTKTKLKTKTKSAARRGEQEAGKVR